MACISASPSLFLISSEFCQYAREKPTSLSFVSSFPQLKISINSVRNSSFLTPNKSSREVMFLIWAYIPEPWLHSVGITYYPSRYWALAAPTYAMVTVALAVGFYIGLNFMATPPPTSLSTIFDEHDREHSSFADSMEGDELPIKPISDIGINQVNDLIFNPAN